MKYLNKFNEELKPQTYRRAATKLNKKFPERAEELRNWVDQRARVDARKMEKFGKFKLKKNFENDKTKRWERWAQADQ